MADTKMSNTVAHGSSPNIKIDLQSPDPKTQQQQQQKNHGFHSKKSSDNDSTGPSPSSQQSQSNNSNNNNNHHQQSPASNNSMASNKQFNSKKRKLNNASNLNHNNQHQHQQNNNQHGGGGGNNVGQLSERGGGIGKFNDQLAQHIAIHRLTGSPAWDLQPQNTSAQTFTGRCRLFVANLPSNVTEESLRKLFEEFGQISDIFIGKGNQFAFIKMDTRSNAENAKNAVDGRSFEGRTLRVRLAAHAAAIKVTNLPPCVSNELLHLAFSSFGPIERAIVVADDRGRSLNEGLIEFARKSSAQAAIKKCQNECLLLSSTPIPVGATSLESRDEEEGVPEKNVLHNPDYRKERELGPRFTDPTTIEHEIANKWKLFIQHEADRRAAFEAEMHDKRESFQLQMEYFRLEESCKELREKLRIMESQVQQFNVERDARFDYERQREDQRRQHENVLRQQEEQLVGQPHNHSELTVLRRQESDLRQQANALQQILDRQEQSLRQMDPSIGQHMDSNMYGQPTMHGGQPTQMMGAGPHQPPPVPPPGANPMQMSPYGPPPPQQAQPPGNYPQQPPPHSQMTHYGHHPHHHHHHPQMQPQPGQVPGAQMARPGPLPPIVPYNGVPPPSQQMVMPSQQQQQQQQQSSPYGQPPPPAPPSSSSQQHQQQQQQPMGPMVGPQQMGGMGMNHNGGNGGNYGGKRNRRY